MRPSARAASAIVIAIFAGSCAAIPQGAAPPPPAPPSYRPAPPPVAVPPRPSATVAGDFGFQGTISQGGLLIGTAPAGTAAITLDGQPVRIGANGRFIIGFDRDHGPSAVIEARLADGGVRRQVLAVAPRSWDIQSLPTLPRGTTPTPEFVRRRAAEQAMIGAARRIDPQTDGWQQRFAWPVAGRISGRFGSQRIYAGEPGSYHTGTDIARPTGTPVASPADGVVILASPPLFSIEGNLLLIDHGMGLNSALMHLSRIDVKVGDRVVRGQIVGAVGMTGRATGPHLHWGLKWNEARIDPMLLAGPMTPQ